MYILLIFVHTLFIIFSHIFGYYILEGIFCILLLFFLLYFSPIFFFKTKKQTLSDLLSFNISPQKSLTIPFLLTYIGIYLLAFTFSGDIHQSIHIHLLIFLAIYAIFLGYVFSFFWKNDIFFNVLRLHLFFSYLTLTIIGVYYFFFPEQTTLLDVVFGATVLGFSLFYVSFEKKIHFPFLIGFLFSPFLCSQLILLFLFPTIPHTSLCGGELLLAILLFENIQKKGLFQVFFQEARMFFLSATLLFSAMLSIFLFWSFESLYFLMVALIFLFSIHIRYMNLIAYGSALGILYLIYGFLFFPLITPNSLLSTLVFIFFFPIMLIANTYFWKEKHTYDFLILHYSSIFFSAIFFLYSAFFVSWEGAYTLFLSFSVFLFATLYTLSYFRFHIPQKK